MESSAIPFHKVACSLADARIRVLRVAESTIRIRILAFSANIRLNIDPS